MSKAGGHHFDLDFLIASENSLFLFLRSKHKIAKRYREFLSFLLSLKVVAVLTIMKFQQNIFILILQLKIIDSNWIVCLEAEFDVAELKGYPGGSHEPSSPRWRAFEVS